MSFSGDASAWAAALPSKGGVDEIEGEQFGADGGAFARVGHEGDVEAVKEVGGNHRKLAAGGFSAGVP